MSDKEHEESADIPQISDTEESHYVKSLAKLSRTKFNWTEPSRFAIPRLITKSSFKRRAPQSPFSAQSDNISETVLKIVEPEYSESQLKLSTTMTIDKLQVFFEESVREILCSTSEEEYGENLVCEFISNFLDGTEENEKEVSEMIKRLLSIPRLWSECEYSKFIKNQTKFHQQTDDITSKRIADLLQESFRDSQKKSAAKSELSDTRKKLRILYYTKACLMCRLPPKQFMLQALEATDRELLCAKGTTKEKLTDHDVLSITIAVKCGLKVKDLCLRYNEITDFGVWHLCYTLKTFKWPLVILDLAFNNIDEKGAANLSEILKGNATLKTLTLRGNKIGDYGNLCIAHALDLNFHLNSLDLADTDAEMKSTVALFVTLRSHSSIRCLKLGRPLISSQQEESLHHLARTFQMNKVLEEIHIPKFNITDRGIALLVTGLIHNKFITYLDLSCNKIVWDGGASLASYLAVNRSLKTLNLHANRIETPGAESIANVLSEQNSTLKKLIISNNNISSQGLCSIAWSLQSNKTLTHLHVWGNKLETTACVAMSMLLQSGRLILANVDFIPYVSFDGTVYLASANIRSTDV